MEITIKPVTNSARYVVEVDTYTPEDGTVTTIEVLTADELFEALRARLPYKPQGPLKSNVKGVK